MEMHRERTWIVVANRGGARVFNLVGHDPPVKVVDLENPRGRLKSSEINADRSGRSFQRIGPSRSAMSKPHDPVLHEAETFAKSIADMLDHAAHEHRFERLVLVAEPHFLGLLRAELSEPTATRVIGSFAKDFAGAGDAELERSLPAMLS